MNRWQFRLACLVSATCLVLALAVVWIGRSGNQLQAQLQAQQDEINRGVMSERVGGNILRDMATAAVGNARMRDLLARNGYSLTSGSAPQNNVPARAPAAPARKP